MILCRYDFLYALFVVPRLEALPGCRVLESS